MTFSFPLNGTIDDFNQSFKVYQWVVWDITNQRWEEIETIYNQVLHSWQTTYIGFNNNFALIEKEELTKIRSVELGGGQIPSFEFSIVIIAFTVYYGISIRKKRKLGEKNVK